MTWPERFIATNLKFDFAKYGFTNATFQVDSQLGSVIVPLNDSRLWRCTYMESSRLPEEAFFRTDTRSLSRPTAGRRSL